MTLENKALTYGAVKYSITILVFVIPMISTVISNMNSISQLEAKQNEIEIHFKEEAKTYDEFKDRLSSQDVKYAEIKATLESIKVTQSDILSRLPKYKYPVN